MTTFDEAGRAVLSMAELVEVEHIIGLYEGTGYDSAEHTLARYTVHASDRAMLIRLGRKADDRSDEEIAQHIAEATREGWDADEYLVAVGLRAYTELPRSRRPKA